MEQDDLGDWLSPLSRNNEAPPSPSPLAAPPGTPHAGVGAGAGLVHAMHRIEEEVGEEDAYP